MDEQNLYNELFGEESPLREAVPIKRLERSADNTILTGVCGGLAKYFGKEASTIRIITAMLLLLGGWIVAAYLIIAFLLPSGKPSENITENEINTIEKENFRTIFSSLFIVTGLYFSFAEIGLISTSSIFFFPNGFMFPLLAIAAGVFLFMNKFTRSFLSTNEARNFYRSTQDKLVFGVCGGIAKYLKIDSSSLRIIFVLLTGLTLGLFLFAYIVLAITAAKEPPKHIFSNE